MPASMLTETMSSKAVEEDRPLTPLEVHRFHSLRTLFLMGYVVVILAVLAELRYYPHVTDLGKLMYVFGLLIGPAALFLLLLHLYETRGLIRSGAHAVPLTVDFTYFFFVVVSAVSFALFFRAFQVYGVNAPVFSLNWFAGILLLAGEVLVCLLAARVVVRRWIAPRLPSFFKPVEAHRRFHQPRERARFMLHRNIPNWSIWEQDDCYTRIKRV
jgi:hypothetical protein